MYRDSNFVFEKRYEGVVAQLLGIHRENSLLLPESSKLENDF